MHIESKVIPVNKLGIIDEYNFTFTKYAVG